MPYSSAQISGLIGGQTAMFSNNAAYAQQISGGMWGISQPAGGMQNPFPSYAQAPNPLGENFGAQVAGGAGMAIPGIATGATIGAGLMGGAVGWADPFTASGRMFARGIGAGGQGITGTLGHLGGVFRTAGMRAGLGALGTGLGAAALTALPFAAAGAGIQKVGESIYSGAQDVSEVGGMASQFIAPQYGMPGAGSGGKLPRHQIKSIVNMMQDIASDDVMQSMDSLKRIMDRAGQMGMFGGTMDAGEFRRRFKGIVSQTKQVARILGGTLEDALPVVNQLTQMGLWSSRDILGTSVAMKGVGAEAAPHMLATMGAGAQMAHAQGGRMQAGAYMGRQSFLDVQAMARGGMLSEADIRQYTGGVGGVAGQRQMATQLTGVMSQFGNSAAGRLMMAGLGEMNEEGQFTGRMDKEKMAQWQRGELGFDELQQTGRQRTSGNQVSAMSFFRKQETMAQELGAQGGMEGMATAIERAMEKSGHARGGAYGEEARHQFIQKMLGVSNKQAELIGQMIKDLPRIRDERARQMEQALDQAFRGVDEKMNRSWGGVGQAVGHAWDEFWKPMREFGTDLATSMGELGDDMTDKILGRVRDIPITQRERMQRLREGALTQKPMQVLQGLGITGVGQRALDTSWAERIRGQGFLGGTLSTSWEGSRSQALQEAGLQSVQGGGIQLTRGGKVSETSIEQMEFTQTRMLQRSMSSTLGQMGYKDVDRKDMESVKSGLRRIMTDPRTANELRKLKEEDPRTYNRKMVEALRQADPEAAKAMDRMASKGRGAKDSRMLDIVSAAQTEAKLGAGELSAQFGGDVVPNFANLDEVRQFESKQAAAAADALGGMSTGEAAGLGAKIGAGVGAITGFGIGAAPGAAIGAMVGSFFGGEQLSKAEATEMLSGGMAGDISEYIESIQNGSTADNEFTRNALKDKNSTEAKLMRLLQESGGEERQKFLDATKKFGAARGARVGLQERERIKQLASAQGRISAKQAGISESSAGTLEQIREAYAAGDIEQAQELAGGLSRGLGKGELGKLAGGRGGVFGREVAGLGMIGGLEGGMDAKGWQGFQEKLNQTMMFNVTGSLSKDQQSKIKEMVESGGSLDFEEATQVKGMLKDLVKAVGPGQGTGARKTTNESMMQQLQAYTTANEKFVFTATEALVKLGNYDTKKATEEFTEATKAIRGQQKE